jgi:hypothetical protein
MPDDDAWSDLGGGTPSDATARAGAGPAPAPPTATQPRPCHDPDCHHGWTGETPEGAMIPCRNCRPWHYEPR